MQVGDRYERLTIIKVEDSWLEVRCDCGSVKRIHRSKWGKTKSCGCLSLEIARNRFTQDNPGKRQQIESLEGRIFGRLLVIRYAGRDRFGQPMWKCKCQCGKTCIVRGYSLVHGRTKSCGCLNLEVARERFIRNNPGKNQQIEDLKGYIFGRLRVIEYFGRAPSGHPLWRCRCQCGNIHVVRADSLLQGRSRSCGCLREEIARLRRQRSDEGHRLSQLRQQQNLGPRAAPG